MATEALYGSKVMTLVANSTPSKMAPVGLLGGRIRFANDTVEVTAAASAGSTYNLARLPANARIITNLSKLHWDDLGTTTSTLQVGLYGVDDSTNDDQNMIGTALDPTSAGSGAVGPIPIANYGKTIWELLSFSSDPGGLFDVRVTTVTAGQSVGGTLTLELAYTVD
tara:strand:- start:8766 stop:9266 length:501 start_codon:yes stop_codon:yes gene_type:complete